MTCVLASGFSHGLCDSPHVPCRDAGVGGQLSTSSQRDGARGVDIFDLFVRIYLTHSSRRARTDTFRAIKWLEEGGLFWLALWLYLLQNHSLCLWTRTKVVLYHLYRLMFLFIATPSNTASCPSCAVHRAGVSSTLSSFESNRFQGTAL